MCFISGLQSNNIKAIILNVPKFQLKMKLGKKKAQYICTEDIHVCTAPTPRLFCSVQV